MNNGECSGPAQSSERPQFVQDAWNEGLELSTLAASDDHLGQPGKPQFGLTAVLAEDTTRAAVFDALYERRTYGTTGARVLLDFSVGGAPMGSRVALEEAPVVSVEVHGTDTILWVEVLRNNQDGAGFEVVRRNEPRQLGVTWKFRDTDWTPGSVYYVRVRQSGDIRGRAVMAWSSPVWVDAP